MNVTPIVEVAFVADPYGTLVWTDVTSLVRSGDGHPPIKTDRGRNYELDKADAGIAGLRLKNWDGLFDPLNAASDHAPYVLPYRPMRVQAVCDGDTYGRWRGFIRSWPQSWSKGGIAGYVDVEAVDAVRTVLAYLIGQSYAAMLDNYNVSNHRSMNGEGSWVGDGTGTAPVQVPTAVSGHTETTVAGLIAGTDGAGQARALTTNATTAADLWHYGDVAGTAHTWEVWFRVDDLGWVTDGAGTAVSHIKVYAFESFAGSGGGATDVQLPQSGLVLIKTPGANDHGNLQLRWNSVNYDTGFKPAIGDTHHYAVTWDGDTPTGTVRVGVDGELVLTQAGLTPVTFTAGFGLTSYGAAATTNEATATWDEIARYNEVLPNAAILAHYTAGFLYRDWPEQLTSERFDQILDAVFWPAVGRDIETGAVTMPATGTATGSNVLALMQDAVDAELGNMFIDGDGKAVFHAAEHRDAASAVAVFGDEPGEISYLGDFNVNFDDTHVYNTIQVTNATNDRMYEATDLDSLALYGVRTLARSIRLPTTDGAVAQAQADRLLGWYANPRPRVPSLTVDIAFSDRAADVLALEIGDLITVRRRPAGAPEISLDCFIDGISDQVTPGSWRVMFMLTPQFGTSVAAFYPADDMYPADDLYPAG